MSDPDDPTVLHVHPRPSEAVSLSISVDTLAAIRQVAETRDMSPEALMKLHTGHGLWQDASIRVDENDARRPNATTVRALADAQARQRLTGFGNVDELFEDLRI